MDDRAVNPVALDFSRSADACDRNDFPGTSSRRTQLFTFQRAANRAAATATTAQPGHIRPDHCRVHSLGKATILPKLPALSRAVKIPQPH